LFWTEDLVWWGVLFRDILYFYPPFLFAKTFSSISKKSGFHFSTADNRWIRGDGFTYADLVTTETGKGIAGAYTAPSVIYFWGLFIVNCFFWGALSWYCDHVVSSNRGKDESFFFFLKRNYWSCCK